MDRRVLLALVVVVLFAISTRAFLYHWDNIFGIDSYWFARLGSYVYRYDHLIWPDPLYSYGFEHYKYPKLLAQYYPAWYYTFSHREYNREEWMDTFKDLGVLFGTLGSVTSGLIGLSLGGPVAGVLSGLFAATNPGYVYRTMAGFYEDDAPGLFLYLLGLYLLIEAFRKRDKKKKAIFMVAGALTWALLGMTWKAFPLVVYTVVVFVGLFLGRWIWDRMREKVKLENHLHGAVLASLLVFLLWIVWRFWALHSAVSTLERTGFLSTNINLVGAVLLLTLGVHPLAIVLMGLFGYYLALTLLKREKKFLLYAAGLFLLSIPFFSFSASHGFYQVVTMSDGREAYIGYGEAFKAVSGNVPGVDLYQVIFGNVFLIFLAQMVGAFVALLLKESDSLDKASLKDLGLFLAVMAVVLTVPYFFNGTAWWKILNLWERLGVLEQRKSVIGFTVVEERYGYFFWAPKYSWLALVPLFIAPFLAIKTHRKEWVLFTAAVLLTLYAGWIKLKFCYYFGPTIAILAGLFFADVWNELKEEKYRKLITGLLVVLVLSLLATGIFHTVGRIPTLLNQKEVNEAILLAPMASDTTWIHGPDYLAAFQFIEKNTEKNAPLFNWWGIGNWLTFFTEHPVVTDPTNAIAKANKFVASSMLSDWNEAYQRIKEKNFAYAVWLRNYIYASDSFALYAYGYEHGIRYALEKARDYTFFITGDCQKTSVGNYYNCGNESNPLWVDADIVESAPSILMAPLPFDQLPHIRSGLGVYRLGNRLVIVSEKMNRSLMFLLWRGGNEHFIPVFVSPTGYITIYKIN